MLIIPGPGCNTDHIENIQKKIQEGYELWLQQIKSQLIIGNSNIRCWISGFSTPISNVVTFTCGAHEQLKNFLDTIDTIIADKKIPVTWWITPIAQPDNIEDILKNNKFLSYTNFIIMSHALQDIPDIKNNPSIVIKKINKNKEVNSWINIVAHASQFDNLLAHTYCQAIVRDINTQGFEYYAGYYNGVLVATGSLIIKDSWAEIDNIATIPEFQHKGIASSMIQYMLKCAQLHSLQIAVLLSTTQAKTMYHKLGFDNLYTMNIYVKYPH